MFGAECLEIECFSEKFYEDEILVILTAPLLFIKPYGTWFGVKDRGCYKLAQGLNANDSYQGFSTQLGFDMI